MSILKSSRRVGVVGLVLGLVWSGEAYGQGFSSAGGVRGGGVRSLGSSGQSSRRGLSARPGAGSVNRKSSYTVRGSHSEPLTDRVVLNPYRRPRSPSHPIAPAIPTIGGSAVGFVNRAKLVVAVRGSVEDAFSTEATGIASASPRSSSLNGYGYRGYDVGYSCPDVSEVEPEVVARPYAQYVMPGRSSDVAASAKIYEVRPTRDRGSSGSTYQRASALRRPRLKTRPSTDRSQGRSHLHCP